MANVASLYSQLGNVYGRAAEARAQLRGQLLAGLGRIPGDVMAQRREREALQAQAEHRAQQMALERAREERLVGQEQRAEQAATRAGEQASQIEDIYSAAFEGGTFDFAKGVARAQELGRADVIPLLKKHEQDWQAAAPKLTTVTTRDASGRVTSTLQPEAPGLVTETKEPEQKAFTFGQPFDAVVNGKHVLLRTRSDGQNVDMRGNVVQQDVGAYTKPEKPPDERLVQIMGPAGTPIWVRESTAVGKPAAQAARAVTGQERQSLAFYNRAADAVNTLTQGGDNSLEQRMAKQGIAGQAQLAYAPNIAQSSEQQSYRQAQRAFTEARLRKESGAAIPAGEYENDARTYFAQPGDSPETITQKQKARQVVLDGLKFAAGKAYDEYYGEPNVSPPRQQDVKTPVEGQEGQINGVPAVWKTVKGKAGWYAR
jgi:hypothetical protein